MASAAYAAGFGEQEDEIFFSTYEPTKEEILEYAAKIGIEPDKETNLIYLARQGLLHPLPENWKPCYSKQVKAYYYYDRITKKSQWEHPIDVLYRAKVLDARKALSLDRSDSTSLGDSGFRSLKSAHNKGDPSGAAGRPSSSFAGAQKTATGVPQDAGSASGLKPTDQRPAKEPFDPAFKAQARRAHGDCLPAAQFYGEQDEEESDSNKENNSQEAVILTTVAASCEAARNPDMALSSKLPLNGGGAHGRELSLDTGKADATGAGSSRFAAGFQSFTITGTGSQFLKSNKKPEPGGVDVMRKSDTEVKGILRDSSLTYIRSKSTPNEDSGSDERKSVRFDIDLCAELKANKTVETVRDDSLINFEEIEEAYDNDPDDKRDKAEGDEEEEEEEEEDDDYDEADYERGDHPGDGGRNIDGRMVHREASDGGQFEEYAKPQPSSSETSEQDSEVPVVGASGGTLAQRVAMKDGQRNVQSVSVLPVSMTDKAAGQATTASGGETDSVRQLKETVERERAMYRARLEDELHSIEALEEANIKKELSKVQHRYSELLEQEKQRLEEQHRQNIAEIKEFYQVKLGEMKADYEEENAKEYTVYRETLQEEFDRRVQTVTDEHRATMATLQKNHDEIVEELERDLKMEEELLKKEHSTNLIEIKIKLSHELEVERQRMRETGEDRLYEKVRCEKRLLEDKYKCLKEKYTRLKTDVRISLERRKKRREQQQQQQQHSLLSNGYETDRTNSKPLQPYSYDVGKGSSATPTGNTVLTSEKSSISTPPPSAASKRFPANSSGYALQGQSKLLLYNCSAESSQARKPLMLSHNNIQNNNNNTNNNNRLMQADDTSQSETTYSKNYFQIRNIFASVQCEDNISSDSEFDKRHHEKGKAAVAGGAPTPGSAGAGAGATRPKRKIFTKTKSASTSKLNATKHERDADGRPCTAVENLRIQLKKLEELEDQIPDCNHDAPYHLRYPFVHEHIDSSGAGGDAGGGSGGGTGGPSVAVVGSSNGSSELEFFKHRILLERDSVMRAKESLRAQKHVFKRKQCDSSIKSALKNRHNMDQIFNDEKELTEMEVSLHRTRALLGEKVIRLRHLERSLHKLSEKDCPQLRPGSTDRVLKAKETLSDLSSYSSSGFSSTELPITEHQYGRLGKTGAMADPSDGFKYLEHLHAEIQEIWSLLNPCTDSHTVFDEMDFLNNSNTITGTQFCDMVLPPTPAAGTGSGAPPIGQHPLAGQQLHQQQHQQQQQHHHRQHYTANLLEKTRDLKNWLRHAKSEHEMLKKNSFG